MAWPTVGYLRRQTRSRYRYPVILVLFLLYVFFPIPWPSGHAPYEYSNHHLTFRGTPVIQHAFTTPSADTGRLKAVKAEFVHAYNAYRSRAWMHDEVKPLSGGTHTQYCGWAATLIDALDTLYIMGLEEEFEEAVAAVHRMKLWYAPSLACSINPFEMTIRHLGGLLSAYDISGQRDERLKRKAVGMGEMLLQAFGRNGIQCRAILWPRLWGWPCTPNSGVSFARMGSQLLEFVRLSMVSGKRKWSDRADFAAQELLRVQNKSRIPGLWPRNFDGTCDQGLCDLTDGPQFYTTASGADSSYEYFVKTHLLYGAVDDSYARMWAAALPQLKKHILFRPQAPNNADLLFPGEIMTFKDLPQSFSGKVEHLSCFLGGLFALSSRTVIDNTEDIEIAAKLTNGCVWAYESTASGIMPDTVVFEPCPPSNPKCTWNELSFAANTRKHGDATLPKGFIKVERPEYLLRPEAIESVFYMYRITGDEIWREKGWRMFTAIRDASRAKYGHASVANALVNATGQVEENQMDKMESFWLSETLKYFYLLFADPRLVSLDEWVFNTEGHPFRIDEEYRGQMYA
ncbi:Endoplasmic reticulum mannosyl-oligosaccharide 1,2-alpha-mannosidase [Cyphellophora attinorum]|uniref:alpha-1,2-Mannosidase n=1 Tax=Cyphellophora attinorum TaxID=1664694 RepID=A0A0N0NQT4_9EURO|nr:Endoplasmic reticulum mannosyl-oligosaccharide 1,2-alpha-mannosidase [Phialophora attinorum]KPI44291.1 Endoplasmic reticulum mannosyl-oligosaccharide 1,2-alpha-mannosidase [Phialophora attinorum]